MAQMHKRVVGRAQQPWQGSVGVIRALAAAAGVLLLCQCGAGGLDVHPELISHGQFAGVRIYRPAGPARQLTLLLSGDGGWGSGPDAIAHGLALQGTLVAGIDARAWLKQLQAVPVSCVSPGAYLAELARYLQARYGLPAQPALLVGHSAGATLAYVALAQARPRTFAGAATLSFCADLDLTRPLCPSPALREMPRASGVRLLPAALLGARWVALHGVDDRTCPVADSRTFSQGVPGARYLPLPGIGHTYDVSEYWWPLFTRAYAELSSPAATPASPVAAGEGLP